MQVRRKHPNMSNDPSARRLLPQSSQMGSFSFAPPAYQQQPRETQKSAPTVESSLSMFGLGPDLSSQIMYSWTNTTATSGSRVWASPSKPLSQLQPQANLPHTVMRACEGCRRRKIKCDAATTNTWPCSACIRLKLHCVRPNGFDTSADSQGYEPAQSQFETTTHVPESFRHPLPLAEQQQLLAHAPKPPSIYPPQTTYPDTSGLYHPVQYTEPHPVPSNLQYTPVHHHPSVVDQQYAAPPTSFPTPPLQHAPNPGSPDEAFQSEYAQQDLADLLGSLKVNEAGTGTLCPRWQHLRTH